jgi:hypothetical protein
MKEGKNIPRLLILFQLHILEGNDRGLGKIVNRTKAKAKRTPQD